MDIDPEEMTRGDQFNVVYGVNVSTIKLCKVEVATE